MNTIYRIVWNAATGKWVVASELAKGRKKKSTPLLSAIALVGLMGGASIGTAAAQTATQLGDNATATCGAYASGGLLNPAITGNPTICGTAIGSNSIANQGGAALGDHAITSGSYGVALGAYSLAANRGTAVGASAMATGTYSFAGGVNTQALGNSSVAIGSAAKALDVASIAVGNNAIAGTGGTSVGANQIALGLSANALGDRSIAIGAISNVAAEAAYGMAIGRSSNVTAAGVNSVALGQASVADRANTVSVGALGTERQIVNVAKGTADTDAVNLSQLKGTATSIANAVGGGSTVASDGTITAPTYSVGGANVHTVGDALSNLDGRVTTNAGDIVNIRNQMGNGSIGLVQQDQASGDITVAKDKNGTRVDFTGTAGARKLAGVAAGGLSATSTEAVNGSQLFATNERVTKNEGDIVTIGDRVTNTETSITNLDGRVTTNEGDIVAMGDRVTNNETSITNLDGRVTTNEGDIIAMGDRVTNNETNITNLDGRVTSAETNITSIDGRVTKNEGDIVNIRNDLSSGAIGLVQQDETSGDITVAKDTNGTRVDFTGTAGARKLAGVAAGELSATSAEAVNGSQLFATNERVTKNEGDIVTIGDRVTNTETSITSIDGRVTKNEGDIVNIRNELGSGSVGLVQQDQATGDITVAKDANGARVDFTGTDGARKLAGVAAGELSESSTEAVNGSQLFATNERVTKNEGDIVTIGDRVTNTETSITNLDGRVTTNEGNIVAIGDRVTNTETNITNLDSRLTTNEGDIVNIRNDLGSGSIGLVQQAGASAAVTVAAVAGGSIVDFTGTDGTRQLKGVSKGEDATDAVNVAQLRDELAGVSVGDTRYLKTNGANDGTDDAVATGDRSVAMGASARTGADGAVALGSGASALGANSVALGSGSSADRANSVSVGSAGNERQIVNVADGTEDTDAVNVRQLKASGLVGDDGSLMDAVVYDAGSNRGSITLGGVAGTTITNVMAGLVAPGSMDAINGSQLWGVQDQINKLGDRVTTIEIGGGGVAPDPSPDRPGSGDNSTVIGAGSTAPGDSSVAIGAGSSAKGDNSVAVGAGSVADRDNTVSVGSPGNERQITNVAAGTARTDAANVGQLQDAMSNMQDWTQGQVNGLSKKIDNVQRQANRGIAASAALVNNMPYLPGKVTLNAGVAAYRGQSALGVGVSRWSENGRFNLNAGISAAQGDSPIFRVGVGVVLGD